MSSDEQVENYKSSTNLSEIPNVPESSKQGNSESTANETTPKQVEEPSNSATKPIRESTKDKMVVKGMAFILQQIRSSANPKKTPVTTSHPKNDLHVVKTSGVEEPVNISTAQKRTVENDPNEIQQLKLQKFEADVMFNFMSRPNAETTVCLESEPFENIRDCFAEGTAPKFFFSQKVAENNYLRSCKWRPDGLALFAESEDRRVRLFHFENMKLKLHSTIRSGDLIYDVQWHPNCDLFATTSKEHPIHLWDSDGKLRVSFRGINHLDELSSAYSTAFSLSGEKLWAGYYKTIRIFELERPGRQISELKTFEKGNYGQKAILSCIATCPTMSGIYAIGCFSGSIGLYSEQTGKCDCLFSTDCNGITHLQYSSDGNLIFTGYRRNSFIDCFDLRFPGHVLSKFYRPAETSQRFYFQLDRFDRYLFSGSSSGNILIYDLKRCQSNSITNPEAIKPHWTVSASRAAVTGLSVHQSLPIIAVTTGQRIFPKPLASSDSDSDNDLSNDYIFYKQKSLDNALKLWKL